MKTRSNTTLWTIATILLAAALLAGYGIHSGRSSGASDSLSGKNTEPATRAATSAKPGLSGRDEGGTRNSSRMSKEDATARAKALAARLIPLTARSTSGEPPGPGDQEEMFSQLEELSRFNKEQMKVLITEISLSPDLDTRGKVESCGFILNLMADTDPAGALDLLSELHPLLGAPKMGVPIIRLMETVAETQAPAATAWLLNHTGLFEDPMQLEAAKGRILKGVAGGDPAMAFELMDRLQVSNPTQAMADIVRSSHTNEERLGLLTAMRKKAGAMNDPGTSEKFRNDLLSAMGGAMAGDPSSKTEAFLRSAGLTEDEKAVLLEAGGRRD